MLQVSVAVAPDESCGEGSGGGGKDKDGGAGCYLVDVGFGEPPLAPLRYDEAALGVTQCTPEGMKSRIVPVGGDGCSYRMEWWVVQQFSTVCPSHRVAALHTAAAAARKKSGSSRRSAYQMFCADPRVRAQAEVQLRESEARVGVGARAVAAPAVRAGGSGGARRVGGKCPELAKLMGQQWAELDSTSKAKYAKDADNERATLTSAAEAAEAEAEAAAKAEDGTSHGFWEPRLQWSGADAPLGAIEFPRAAGAPGAGPLLQSFAPACRLITSPQSTFTQRLVVCTLTRDAKVTVSATRLKVTTPRFARPEAPVTQTVQDLGSVDNVRAVLAERFGIALCETAALDLERSEALVNRRIWEHL